jgi:hypothetical protein
MFSDSALQRSEDEKKIRIANVDYHKFKLFQLSLIWRMGISTRREFINVKLGPKHVEKLRKMILNSQPGEPHEYPCIMAVNMRKSEIDLRELIVSPERLRFMDHMAYKVLVAGYMWVFIVSSHSKIIKYEGHLWLDHRGLVFHKIDIDLNQALAPILEMISMNP